MKSTRSVRVAIVACTVAIAGSGAAAPLQNPERPTAGTAAGGHKHYVAPGRDVPNQKGELAPRLQNVGKYVFPVTTKNAKAQLFMNQGVNLSYAFNHAESGRAFREAARLDPTLAMAYWGLALVLGPNINAAMEATDEAPAYAAIQKAVSMKDLASPREQAFIDALARRYTGKPEDRQARD